MVSSPGHIRKQQQRLVALTEQLVESIVGIIREVLTLADMLVSLSQDVMPSLPMQQVFVTEVREEKLGISSQCSPQEHTVTFGRRQWCSATASKCDDSRARSSQDGFLPVPEEGFFRGRYFFGSPYHCDREDFSSLPRADHDDHRFLSPTFQ